jgi:eukaryotic-like serine/threonine-protein kinase
MACLDEAEIAEYLDGVLPADRLAIAEAHIDECPSCYQLVVQALAVDDPRRVRGEGPTEPSGGSTVVDPGSTLPANLGDPDAESSGAVRLLAEASSRYTILELRGRGGQACVYAAYDEYLRREIALKVIEADPGAGEGVPPPSRREVELRFLREIGISSQLVHPSIVHVYDAGKRADGSLFYTMQLVQGTTLSWALLDASSIAERLALLRNFVDVCNAVAYAHSRGVLHRDIKPSNVMLGEFGETVVLDWGLAKTRASPGDVVLPEAQDRTLEGSIFGTPRYMSPEQAAGEPLDERSDTWALGVVLFEILTGAAPFEADSSRSILRAVREGHAPRVRALAPDAPAELADIAEKALRRDPAQRYQSAKQLADDVVAYMTGRRVDAHEYSAWEVTKRFALRHKAAVSAAAMVLLTLLVAAVLVLISYRNERRARERESAARVEERDARLLAQLRLSQSFASKARILGEEQDLLASRIYAAASLQSNPAHPRSPSHEPQFASRYPESRLLLAEAQSALMGARDRSIRGLVKTIPADGILHKLAVTPDGRRAAGVGPNDGFRLWDLSSGALIADARGKDAEQDCIAVSPNGDVIATGGFGGNVLVRSAIDGAALQSLKGHTDSVRAVAFSGSGRQLASAGSDSTVRLWSTEPWQIEAVLPAGKQITAAAYRPRTSTLALGCRDGSVQLWDAAAKIKFGDLRAHGDPVETLAFSADGARLLSGAQDRTAKVWNADSGALLASLEPHQESVVGAEFSPDGRWIVTVARDGLVRLWHASDYVLAQVLTAHRMEAYDAVFTGGGAGLLTCGAERNVRHWELAANRTTTAFRGHKGIVFSVAFSPDGRVLASGGIDNTVRIWDAHTGAEKHRWSGHQQAVMRVAFSPDASRVLSASRDRTVRVWSLADGSNLSTWTVASPVYALAVSPGVAAMSGSGSAIVVRALDGSGTPVEWDSKQDKVFALAFSRDGATLASAGADGTVRLWDARTHAPMAVLEAQKNWVTDVKFSADGRWIGAAGKAGIATIWDAASRSMVRELKAHRQWVNELSFAPNGGMAATSSDDRTAVLWDLHTWEPLLVLPMEAAVSSVEFSPDSRVLVAASTGAIRRYSLDLKAAQGDPTEILQEAQRTAGQVLDGVRLEAGSVP